MSAGVCIINKNGIALAADSAITYGNNKMFYNSLNKLFSISEKNICGAVTYGVTSIHGVSLEQILKEFRQYVDSKECLKNLFEILDLFQDYIQNKSAYYQFENGEKTYCVGLISDLVQAWGVDIKKVINEQDAENKIDNILKQYIDKIINSDKGEQYDVSQYIKSNYRDCFEKKIDAVIPEINNFATQKETLWECVCNWFNVINAKEENENSGVLFAGYGENDAFPKYVHISIFNIVNGKIKLKIEEKYDSAKMSSQILPLAQKDVIMTFCKGYSTEIVKEIPQEFAKKVDEKIDNLQGKYTKRQKEELRKEIKKINIGQIMEQKSQSDFVAPLLNSVRNLPLSEMAFLAESLVNITSLKRTYALDGKQQTVGGPIDVAVMSKGDGFTWIKRK